MSYRELLEEFIDTTETAINLTTFAEWLDQRVATADSADAVPKDRGDCWACSGSGVIEEDCYQCGGTGSALEQKP